MFQITSTLQSRRRLGLTATLVREDRKEGHVFTLIGPKRFEIPWKILEEQNWIAKAKCVEYRVPLAAEVRSDYLNAEKRAKFRIAATNPSKIKVVESLISIHKDTRSN